MTVNLQGLELSGGFPRGLSRVRPPPKRAKFKQEALAPSCRNGHQHCGSRRHRQQCADCRLLRRALIADVLGKELGQDLVGNRSLPRPPVVFVNRKSVPNLFRQNIAVGSGLRDEGEGATIWLNRYAESAEKELPRIG